MGIGEFLFYCMMYIVISWIIGLSITKVFNLVIGEKANMLFILRGSIIVVSGMLFYLWIR